MVLRGVDWLVASSRMLRTGDAFFDQFSLRGMVILFNCQENGLIHLEPLADELSNELFRLLNAQHAGIDAEVIALCHSPFLSSIIIIVLGTPMFALLNDLTGVIGRDAFLAYYIIYAK